jgi:hypothetical protein
MAAFQPTDPRLSRVDFPGVDVEHIRRSTAEYFGDATSEQAVGEHAKVASASPGDAAFAQLEARNTHFMKPWPDFLDRFGGIHTLEGAIAVVRYGWECRGIVGKSELLKNVDGPIGD